MTQDMLVQITQELLSKAGIQADVVLAEGPLCRIAITSRNDIADLVGHGGKHMEALEYLVRLLYGKKCNAQSMRDFILDVNDHRKHHTDYLTDLARQAVIRVTVSGRAESLAPMNSFERKIIHTELASHHDVKSQSIGTDPHRRVVISPATLV